ncbi:MAG TPA: ABC transporter ATP-binding protein [bacterium]|nr:ABC transporter ATP-binding protein [bacterium]
MHLRLEGLTLRYGDRLALDDVSASLEGRIIGLLGANASGKTSLLRILAGVQAAARGRAFIDGLEIHVGRRPGLSYLPQEIGGFPFWQRPAETLSGTFILKGIAGHDERAKELLAAVGLGNEDRSAAEFSGGMKQKLRITQALSHAPQVLIMDEPTTGLDTRERFRLLRIIERLRDRVSVLFSTHQPEDVAAVCDVVLILHRGRAAASGTPDAIAGMAKGRVYEVGVPASTLPAESEYEIAAVGRTDGTLRIRVVGEPPAGATPVDPRLEDAYLLLTQH